MKLIRLSLCLAAAMAALADEPHHWSEAEAGQWYARQAWLVGANYIPSSAVNQLEMWQQDTFDPLAIDRELGWAEELGMNTARVFLHDLLWKRDSAGFEKRLNLFLKIADKHHIKPIFVLFDSVWDPCPEYGPQPAPRPGVHNSRWVQSPAAAALMDTHRWDELLAYVQGLLTDFARDKRILAWDLWNEPDNTNGGSYAATDAAGKEKLVAQLLPRVFDYARAALPSQPLTSGLWQGDWSSREKMSAVAQIQLDNSDVISFHNYDPPEEFTKRVEALAQYHRPIICTEYMARPRGSTFQAILPIAKKNNVGAINWGLVAGRTQTYLPWDSWQKPYVDHEPAVWFHEILDKDGKPYSLEEVRFIQTITARNAAKPAKGK